MRARVVEEWVIGSLVSFLLVVGLASGSAAQKPPAPRGEVRVVDHHPANWQSITMNVFEHLVRVDPTGRRVPGLATGWRWLDDVTLEVKLRQGVRFHNGEVFDAEIVKLNWDENRKYNQPFGIGAFMNFPPRSRLELVDRHTVRFVFPEPDSAVFSRFSLLHMANRQFYRELGWGEKHW